MVSQETRSLHLMDAGVAALESNWAMKVCFERTCGTVSDLTRSQFRLQIKKLTVERSDVTQANELGSRVGEQPATSFWHYVGRVLSASQAGEQQRMRPENIHR